MQPLFVLTTHLSSCSLLCSIRTLLTALQSMASPSQSSSSASDDEDRPSSSSSEDGQQAAAPSVASTAGGQTRICHDLKKARTCQLCNCSSSDESPLDYVGEEIFPEASGRVPWRSYDRVKAQDGETVRVPSGRLCLICFNVYRALGSSIAIVVPIILYIIYFLLFPT